MFRDTMVEVDEPILVKVPRLGKIECNREKGKPSKTLFKRLHYDAVSNMSIVQCIPITGRTHQIRVHLHFLGNSLNLS